MVIFRLVVLKVGLHKREPRHLSKDCSSKQYTKTEIKPDCLLMFD